MAGRLTIYQKPTCSTCRDAIKILKDRGVNFTAVNYYETPFTKAQLQAILNKADLSARDIIRTKEDIYKDLKLGTKDVSEDELIDLMLEHPDLIQRPLAEKGERAMLARPAETILKLLRES